MTSDSAIQALAGALGGVVAMTGTYPLIFLSTRSAVEVKKVNKSTIAVVLDIIKREGLLGLYSGLTSSLLGIAVTNGVYYYFYERARHTILHSRSGGKGLSTLESILAGLIAGTATTMISNPLWVIQTSQAVYGMQRKAGDNSESQETNKDSQSGFKDELAAESIAEAKRPNILETIRLILKKDGWTAFWRGIGPALALVINPVIQYTVFEQLKNFLVARRLSKLKSAGIVASAALLTDWDFFFLGALSKLVATSSTYPYIVVKSRLQAGHLQYKSSLDGLLTIVKEEGIEGLYKGIGSKLTQSVLTAAILFAGQKKIYEMTKKMIAARRI
jgi:adenine nucleotide transporter 17